MASKGLVKAANAVKQAAVYKNPTAVGQAVWKCGEVAVHGNDVYATALMRFLGNTGSLEVAMQRVEEHVRASCVVHGSCFLWSRPTADVAWSCYVVRLSDR